jgi:hypothetical protein
MRRGKWNHAERRGQKWPCLFFCQLFKLQEAAEPVEKVQMANSDNFCPLKNQQLREQGKPKNAQI